MSVTIRMIAVVLAAVLISACASKVNNIKSDADRNLSADQGYVLLGIDTNRDLYQIILDGPTRIKLTAEDVAEGDSYILADLEAGEYSIDRLFIDKYRYYRFDEEDNFKFTVHPGSVSYVGHLETVTSGYWNPRTYLQLDNRSAQALVFMQENFPNINDKRKLFYGGPGEDSFLAFEEAMGGTTHE